MALGEYLSQLAAHMEAMVIHYVMPGAGSLRAIEVAMEPWAASDMHAAIMSSSIARWQLLTRSTGNVPEQLRKLREAAASLPPAAALQGSPKVQLQQVGRADLLEALAVCEEVVALIRKDSGLDSPLLTLLSQGHC